MIYRLVNLPVFMEIGENILHDFDKITQKYNLSFQKPLILSGVNSSKVLNRHQSLGTFDRLIVRENSVENAYKIKKNIYGKGYDLLVAMGGGKVVDLCKFLSAETTLPVIVIPTILASDSVSSPISILQINGSLKSLSSIMPLGVLIDLSILKTSPKEHLLAGIGDLLSNLSASYDWELAHRRGYEKMDDFARMLALLPAERLLSKADEYSDLLDVNLLQDLAEGLVLSGIAMGITGSSRPASGSEHNISHSLDRVLGTNKKLHGLQVGFATLLTLQLQKNHQLFEKLLSFYQKIGFPTKINEIGIEAEAFFDAIKIAPTIRNRYTILNEVPYSEVVDVFQTTLM